MKLEQIKHNNTEICFLKGSADKPLVSCIIKGVETNGNNKIINSVPNGKITLLNKWKCKIADEINNKITKSINPRKTAVSLSLFFSMGLHGNKKFDTENFIKPVLDGIAKGLFAKDWSNERKQEKIKFNEDDSLFHSVYFERHDITDFKESIHVTVWEI